MTKVAEIVTFRTLPPFTQDEILARAGAVAAFLKTCPGFIVRTLSQGEDGLWTDHVIWRDRQTARAAAEAFMAAPVCAPFMATIDPASVSMRHETVGLSQMA